MKQYGFVGQRRLISTALHLNESLKEFRVRWNPSELTEVFFYKFEYKFDSTGNVGEPTMLFKK
jgi:hypothetical protein